ncbi:hypothetical protein OG892_25440 [Streptomyces sp. NBC_00341]|uniref:hypothetical protein n=1 Tax=unclassified Streptomyces TaxID=2593676 RepID=UPI00093DF5E1|nr:hypothetical protein [Streptomyces sp. CB02488]OKK24684.1 hypothetical protein AMK09_00265 [Streptomyces sp. CB02488]WRZ13881.1 hypothetical protein OG892_25440 [Streptomyces sp. NBC_00341]
MSRRLGRGTTYGLVAAWAVVVGAGWGLSQWLGEPAATSGPGRVAPPASDAEPGPQPEIGDGDFCDRARSGADAGPSAPPSPSPFPSVPTKTVSAEARLSVVQCSKVIVRDGWREADE